MHGGPISFLRRSVLLGGLALPFHAALGRDRAAGTLDLTGFTGNDFADVPYSDRSPASNRMDIYVPKGPDAVPVVLWVHGGAFWGGDKRAQDVLNRALPGLMAAGIAVAAVNYRLSGEAIWPAQRDDLTAALGYLRSHAVEYGIDPDRLAVFGTSAGGTLALIAGLDEVMLAGGAVKAIAAWFPATLFTEMDDDMVQDGPLSPAEAMARKGSMISRLMGRAVGVDPGRALRASPVTLLDEIPQDRPLPAFLLAAGADDRTISWRQGRRMVDALGARVHPPTVDWQLYPDSGHGSGAFKGEAVGHLVDFLTGALSRS